MSLDGLRAWIGEVERKLGVRTRIFLVLVAIAVGGAATAVYLALDAQSNDVSKGDVEAVETRLLEQINAAGSPQTGALETQVKELQAEVETLEAGEGAEGATGATGTTGSTSATGSTSGGNKATGAAQADGTSTKSSAQSSKVLEKQLEKAAEDAKNAPGGGDKETKGSKDE